jgi:HlyD family secretion protein
MDEKNLHLSPFRTGMSATVDISTKSLRNVLAVPIQAVTTRSDSSELDKKNAAMAKEQSNDEEMVVKNTKDKQSKGSTEEVKPEECTFVYVKGKATLAKVKTGIQDNNYIQILSGLKEGDEVISAPYTAVSKLLKDGSKVEKVDKDKLFKNKTKSN